MSREGTGKTAFVTGASSGIGRAFAYLLAARGYRVVVSARRRNLLEVLAAELRERHAVDALVLAADLSDASAPAAVAGELAARGLHVDVLVNCAGAGPIGRFDQQPWAAAEASIQVMVGAPCELTHRFLPGMIERRWGRIVNVASLAGLLPASASHPLYAASKAFLIRFSEALAAAHAGDGVYVTALCPGLTRSEFHDVAGTRELMRGLPRWMWMNADRVAEQGYAAVTSGRVVYVNGPVNRTLVWLARILPQACLRRVLGARRIR